MEDHILSHFVFRGLFVKFEFACLVFMTLRIYAGILGLADLSSRVLAL